MKGLSLLTEKRGRLLGLARFLNGAYPPAAANCVVAHRFVFSADEWGAPGLHDGKRFAVNSLSSETKGRERR